ncbi:MAG: alpha/beta hydrolase [Desulfobulbus sp.]|nr:alpha/beta hydrolase [Desulfobulbus sp.]
MALITEKTIDLDGVLIHALECGAQEGRTVVLLHGMKFQAQTWQELGTLEALSQLGLHVLAVDMPGFGKSAPAPLPPGEVLARLYAKENFLQAVLIGPSMGGRIATEFAIAHPEKISGLVLVGAVGVEENRAGLLRITAPVLIVWGEEDQVSPMSNSDILLNELSSARREIYPQAPHPCYLGQPDRWHESLKTFFTDLNK